MTPFPTKIETVKLSRIRPQLLSRKILGTLVEAFNDWNDHVTLPWLIRYNVLFPELIEREMTEARRASRIRDALRKMARRRFIEIKISGSKTTVHLTKKGRAIALLDAVRYGKPRTDSQALYVSFDIPERKRSLRRLFRRSLKSAGFKRIHQSFWATDKNVARPLGAWLEVLGVERWVLIIEGHVLK